MVGIPHNPEMLKKVRDTIAKEESIIYMGQAFHGWLWDSSANFSKPNCGTPACIAGWTIHEKYYNTGLNTDHMADAGWTPTNEAREILGLTEVDARELFYLVMDNVNDADDFDVRVCYHWHFDDHVPVESRKEIVLRQLDAILAGEPIDWKKHWMDVRPLTFPTRSSYWP